MGARCRGGYLDDLLNIQRLTMKEQDCGARKEDDNRVEAACDAYAKVLFERDLKKAFLRESDFRAWGAKV